MWGEFSEEDQGHFNEHILFGENGKGSMGCREEGKGSMEGLILQKLLPHTLDSIFLAKGSCSLHLRLPLRSHHHQVQDSKKMSRVCVSNFWEKDVNTKVIFIEWQILNIVVDIWGWQDAQKYFYQQSLWRLLK